MTKLQDEDFLNKMQTPCSVFATFETEEGLQRAIGFLTDAIIFEEPAKPWWT